MNKYIWGMLNVVWELNAELLEPDHLGWFLTNSRVGPFNIRKWRPTGTGFQGGVIPAADPTKNFPYGLNVVPPG